MGIGALGMRDPDEELVQRVGAGDKRAAAELVRRHLPRMVGLARRMLGDAAEAEDVGQEVFLRVWKHAQSWKPGQAKFETWMQAFEEHGLDHAFYTHRQRRTDEVFPWEHIGAALRKNFLFQDFRMSLEGEIRVDCRLNCFACGILPTFANLRRENPG